MKVKMSQKIQEEVRMDELYKNGLKRIALEVFENLLAKQLFSSSSSLFVTFDIMLEKHVCFTRSCDFIIHK